MVLGSHKSTEMTSVISLLRSRTVSLAFVLDRSQPKTKKTIQTLFHALLTTFSEVTEMKQFSCIITSNNGMLTSYVCILICCSLLSSPTKSQARSTIESIRTQSKCGQSRNHNMNVTSWLTAAASQNSRVANHNRANLSVFNVVKTGLCLSKNIPTQSESYLFSKQLLGDRTDRRKTSQEIIRIIVTVFASLYDRRVTLIAIN